jgi:hypothetical protein
MFAALVAALMVCAISLGGATLVAADQPAGHSDNGNHNGWAKAESAPQPAGGRSQSTATSGPGNSSQGCDGTHHSDTGHGANQGGPYDNTCDGSPSGNGNGNGKATGKPCAGCVGNADDKNPKGQMPNGSDHNAGYECDRNHGIGRTNPAHTGCRETTTTNPPPPPGEDKCPNGMPRDEKGNCGQGGDHPDQGGDHSNHGHDGKITICHATGSATNPYVIITISVNGLNGHRDHQDGRDIIPAPEGGCPAASNPENPGNPPGGDNPGANTPNPPGPTVTQTAPPPATITAPATTPPPGAQAVLGERVTAPARSQKPAGRTQVKGANASGGTTPTPAAAQQPLRAAAGTLPFTGTDALLVAFIGSLLLLTGLATMRWDARRS